jgi:hypothetical protein
MITTKTYHIVWFNEPTALYSTGKNYDAIDEAEAIIAFRAEYPDALFHSMSVKYED